MRIMWIGPCRAILAARHGARKESFDPIRRLDLPEVFGSKTANHLFLYREHLSCVGEVWVRLGQQRHWSGAGPIALLGDR